MSYFSVAVQIKSPPVFVQLHIHGSAIFSCTVLREENDQHVNLQKVDVLF